MIRTVLREYIPESWFHPKGIRKVLRRLEPRLPDVQGKLFLTFTFARETCGGDPAAAFEYGRAKLRKVFYALRKGVEWEGQSLRIDEPYCVKVEFHEDGWAHFHVVFLTRRFLPGELLNALWGLGRCNVERITNEGFRYLLKYVCKGGELPDWIKKRGRLRVFQSSHGFLVQPKEDGKAAQVAASGEAVHSDDDGEESANAESAAPQKKRRPGRGARNIEERLARWECMGLVEAGEEDSPQKHYNCVLLRAGFYELLVGNVVRLAQQGRYLGMGRVLITRGEEMLEWIAA